MGTPKTARYLLLFLRGSRRVKLLRTVHGRGADLRRPHRRVRSDRKGGAWPSGSTTTLFRSLVHEIRVDGRDHSWLGSVFGPSNDRRLAPWVVFSPQAPQAGLEPAHPAPEAGALSAELLGLSSSPYRVFP